MKINFVVQRYGEEVVGGAELACRRFATGLASKGHETNVLTTCALESTTWANHFEAGESSDGDVTVLRFPSVSVRGRPFEKLSRKLFESNGVPPRRLQEEWFRAQGPECPGLIDEVERRASEPDVWVFCTYLYYPTVFGIPKARAPVVLHPAVHDEPPAHLPIVKEIIWKADGLAMYTVEEWKAMLGIMGWPPAFGRVIGLGIEEGFGDPQSFRSKFEIGGAPFLLSLSRVDRGKGTDDLVSHFALFKQTNPGPLKLVIAGPVVHEPPRSADVVVTGQLDESEKWAAMQECVAFVHPSPLESFGFTLLEAWSKSKPALVNGMSEVTSGHARRARAGLAYRSADEFEGCLRALLEDPESAKALGRAGRSYAETFFWNEVVDRYEMFLQDLLRKHRPV